MARRSRRHPPVPLILLVVVLLGLAGYVWWSGSRGPAEATGLTASGEMEAREYQIAPAMAGRVTKVLVAEGDTVTNGQAVVGLDRLALGMQLAQARQGAIAARAAVDDAETNGTTADVTAAKARLRQALAAVAIAKVQLGYTVVSAPRDGVVVSVITNVGQNATPGRTLLTVVDPADLFVRVFVPETQLGKVQVGQGATITTDSSSQRFEGRVSFIASQAEFTPNNVQTEDQRVKLVYEVRVRVTDDTGTLKAGMPVDVTFS